MAMICIFEIMANSALKRQVLKGQKAVFNRLLNNLYAQYFPYQRQNRPQGAAEQKLLSMQSNSS